MPKHILPMKFCILPYTGNIWQANLANCELFAKIFLASIHRYTKTVFGIWTDCSLFAKFFLTKAL